MRRDETKFLLSIIKPYKQLVVVVILLSILASVFDGISIGLLVPLISNLQGMEGANGLPKILQWATDSLRRLPSNQQIFIALAFIIVAILLKNLFIAASVRCGHWLSTRLLADLRTKAIKLLMTVSIDFHHKSRAGDLIEKSVNNTHHVEYLLRMCIEFAANAMTLAVLIGMLFLLSWQLTLVAIMLGAAFLLFMLHYTRVLKSLGQKSALTGREFLHAVHESLSGIVLIKSYGQEHEQIPVLNEKIETHRQIQYRCSFRVFSIHPITDVLASLAIVVLFIVALLRYDMNTKLMLTQMLPFIYILLRIVPLLKILHTQRADLVSGWPYVEVVYGLIREDNKPFIRDGEQVFRRLEKEIRFQAVIFGYQAGSRTILQEVHFSIPAGKTTAIIGESGAGKSTVANLLLRLHDPQQGKILIDGVPLPKFRLATYHRRLGIVSQDTFLFNNTVAFNIAFSANRKPSTEEIIKAASQAGAHEFIMELPEGYATLIGDRGVRLSGGQRQRLAIARAIIRDPEILILDEATSSLDVETERRIHQAITKLSQGRTVIIIAHRLSTIRGADQIIVLKNGRVVECGSDYKLFEHLGEYYK
ncbi:MAG: ABC transporter ATP-binding protein, partial [bacterium]